MVRGSSPFGLSLSVSILFYLDAIGSVHELRELSDEDDALVQSPVFWGWID